MTEFSKTNGRGWVVPVLWVVLCAGFLLRPSAASGQSPVSAGTFLFSSDTYIVTENETVAGSGRSIGGAVLTVVRVLGSAGRVRVSYTTVDDFTLTCDDTNSTEAIPDGFAPCPDYLPRSGELVFDDFETSRRFVVPVLPGPFPPAPRNNKVLRVILTGVVPDENENPELIQPVLDPMGTNAAVVIRKINAGNLAFPLVGTTNFVIERATYSLGEQDGSIDVAVRMPSASGGQVRFVASGVEKRPLPGYGYSPIAGSDWANELDTPIGANFTDGSSPFLSPSDFTIVDTVLDFPVGVARMLVTVPVTNDDATEFNEDILVHLIRENNQPPLGVNTRANITILHDEDPAGALDREWNPDGVTSTTPRLNATPGANNIVRAVAVQSDQRTLIGGDFTAYNSFPRNRIARINVDGSVDTSFVPGTGTDDFVSSIAVYSAPGPNNGKILIGGGFTSVNNIQRNGVARLNANGSVDGTFDVGTGVNGVVRSVALQSDGKVLIGGDFTEYDGITRIGVARLNSNGSLDTSFDPGTGPDGAVWAVASFDQPQNIFVARASSGVEIEDINEIETGSSSGTATIDYNFNGDLTSIRVYQDANRLLDLTTNNAGRVVVQYGPGASTILKIVINEGATPDGLAWTYTVSISTPSPTRKIYIGGEFLMVGPEFRPGVARLTESGTVDVSFDPGGGADGPIYALTVQPNGQVLVGGGFGSFDFRNRGRLARLSASGTLDEDYNIGAGANDSVFAISLQPDGKALVGGLFTSFNLTRRMGLTRLFANGTVDTSFLDTAYNQFAGLINTYHFQTPNYVNAVGLQSNGDVMIGGSFTNLGGNFAAELVPIPITPAIAGSTFYRDYNTWNRAEKRCRYNIARLKGGYTLGPGNMEYVYGQNTTDEDAGSLEVALRRIDGRLGLVVALAATTNNLAVGGSDFEEGAAPVGWDQGGGPYSWGDIGEQLFGINIFSDQVVEGDELFGLGLTFPGGFINLSGDIIPLGGALGRSRSIVTVTDDDFSPGVFAFSSSTYSTNEGAIFARFTVVRTNGSAGSVSVKFFSTDGTALAGQDYTANQGTLTFGSGVTSQPFTVRLTDDLSVEPDETFTVTLTNATGGARLPGGTPTSTLSATMKIIDNDFLPGKANFVSPNLAIPAPFATNEGAVFAQVTVERLGGSVGELSVSVGTISGGSATPGTDYTPITNTVTWVHDEVTPKVVLVPLLDDFNVEANETILLRIFNPSIPAGVGTISNATLTVRNDDFYGSLTYSQPIYDTDERGTNIWITVVRTGGNGGTVSANYSVVAGTAVAGVDFTPTSGTLTFGPGVIATNFPVTIFNNTLKDGDRTVLLSLSGFVNASTGANPTATLNIIDDESVGDPAGTLDTTFNLDAGANESINALALQPDGKILAAGAFRMMNRVTRTRVARLNPDGGLDDTFDPRQGPNAPVRAMLLQPPPDPINQPADYRVVLAGQFTQVAGTNRNYIARLLADGTVDNAFNPGGGADNPVFALAPASDHGVVIGGAFATINGISRPGIAILDYSGTVRTTFDPGVGANAAVLALAVQNDGKILVGGEFTSFNGTPRRHLVRLNVNGTVDLGFDPGTGPDGAVRAIALQADGSILVGGSFTNINGTPRIRLAKLSSTGALDPLFQDGTGGANRDVLAIAVQYDTKILVAGEFTTFNGVSRNRITRLNPTGKTDPSINFGGGANDSINTLLIQPDRRIVLAGRFTAYDGENRRFLARIHGGSIAGPGTFQFALPLYTVAETSSRVTLTVVRKGGTAGDIAVDYATVAGTATPNVDYTNVVGALMFPEGEVQLTINVPIINDTLGEFPETFNVNLSNPTGGATLGDIPSAAVLIISDDSAIGFGSAFYTINENVIGGNLMIDVIRIGATNGEARVNFATAGGSATSGTDFRSSAGVLIFLPGQTTQSFNVPIIDDGIIEVNETFGLILSNVVGTAVLGQSTATVTIVDNDFKAGILTVASPVYTVSEAGTSVVVTLNRTNGATGVISVNYATVGGTAIPDVDFVSTTGTLTFIEGQTNRTVTIPIIDDGEVEGDEEFFLRFSNPTGGAALAGVTNVLINILDDEQGPGSVDRNFDPGVGANGLVRAMSVQADGKPVIGGAFTSFDNVSRNFVTRLNTDGSHDLTFDPGLGPNGFVSAVAVTPAGSIVIGGVFNLVDGLPFNRVALLDLTGAAIPFFNANPGLNAEVYFATAQPNGRLILGGGFSQPTRGITRLQPAGAVDVSFSPGTGADGPVHWAVVQPDGMIVIGGGFSNVGGEPRRAVARLASNGFVDTLFNPEIAAGTVFAVALQSDGKVVLGGDFSIGNNRVNIARLNTDGSLDAGFTPGTGANATVYSVGLQSDGHIVLGGDFTTVNGMSRNRLARLNIDGTVDSSFDAGRGANNTVFSVNILPGDDILIAGDFTRISGTPRAGVAKIRGGGLGPVVASFTAASVTGGVGRFSATVMPGYTYVIEASPDLQSWVAVSTNAASTSLLQFTDSNVQQRPARFFRVRRVN